MSRRVLRACAVPCLCEIALSCTGYFLMRWIIVLPWRQRNIRECNLGEIRTFDSNFAIGGKGGQGGGFDGSGGVIGAVSRKNRVVQ